MHTSPRHIHTKFLTLLLSIIQQILKIIYLNNPGLLRTLTIESVIILNVKVEYLPRHSAGGFLYGRTHGHVVEQKKTEFSLLEILTSLRAEHLGKKRDGITGYS